MLTIADPVRCRMLRLLHRHELTVSELCSVLQLPQSTVSRHLKALQDDAWLTARRDGTSRFYRMDPAALTAESRGLWTLLEPQLESGGAESGDDERLETILAERRRKSREFFATEGGRWESLRDELFGRYFHLQALLGMLDERWTVGDFGCGTGLVAQSVAPFVRYVIGVDGSTEMLTAAKQRLEGVSNVELRHGELERLPLRSGTLDAAIMMLVLHYLPDPARALAEAARTVKPGGRLLLVDMLPHERVEYQQQMGHVWLGFGEDQIRRYLEAAGFADFRLVPLTSDFGARGPRLFVAGARRPESAANAKVVRGTRTEDELGSRFEHLETGTAEAPQARVPSA